MGEGYCVITTKLFCELLHALIIDWVWINYTRHKTKNFSSGVKKCGLLGASYGAIN